MEMRAVVIVGGAKGYLERIADVPMALLDVLGRPVLDHVIDRLQQQGVARIAVVGELPEKSSALRRETVTLAHASGPLWRSAEAAFTEQAQGADVVLVFRLGAYLELNIEHLVQTHLDTAARVTAVVDQQGALLDHFVISASRRNDAAFLFRSELKQFRSGFEKYPFSGYCNRLKSAAGLRQLAIDAFSGDNHVVPQGKEIRPGVWVADGARIQRGARLLAPCFIGENAKVRAHAVVTRCSTVERDTCIDYGTVVENSSVLPHTSIGAGLDIVHSVAGFRRIANLARRAEVEITDPKLIDAGHRVAPVRALSQAASLASFLPMQLIKGMFNGQQSKPATLPQAVLAPSPALKESAPSAEGADGEQFPAPFIVARR